MMQEYTVRKRNVNGLEISYVEYQVVVTDRDSLDEKIIEIVASFIHEACAVGLCDQLHKAYSRGVEDALSQAPAPTNDWQTLMADAHSSLDRLEHLAAQALTASLESPSEEAPIWNPQVTPRPRPAAPPPPWRKKDE